MAPLKAFPWGKVGRREPGRMRATCRAESVVHLCTPTPSTLYNVPDPRFVTLFLKKILNFSKIYFSPTQNISASCFDMIPLLLFKNMG